MIETEYLVVGAGPAGAGMASFLAQNGKIPKLNCFVLNDQ
jgi:flavin-dependent dehydrogenase